MASVHKNGNRYYVMYRYETETGEIKQKKVSGFLTKEDAWEKAKELEAKSNAGIEVNPGSMTCAELMEKWFLAKYPTLAASTSAKYSNGIDKLSKTFIADIKIKKMKAEYFNTLIADLMHKISARTAISYTEPLRLSFSWALQEKLIPWNPLENISLPSVGKSKQIILSQKDIDELVCTISSENRRRTDFQIPLLLALYGGLRREECAGLKWEDIDFKHNTITIRDAIVMTPDGKEHLKDPKTHLSSRTISMPSWIMKILKERYQQFLNHSNEWIMKNNPSQRVCVSSVGRPYSCKSYIHPLKRLIDEINADREQKHLPRMPRASFHDLRHTHAAMCIRLSIQPKVIQERLGHASIKITMDLYGYLMPGMQQTVADAFDKEYQEKNIKKEAG